MRVAKAFNTDITFPVVITTVPPSAQPSIDPVLSQQIYRALANYLASRVAAELANDNAEEEAEVGGQTVSDGSGASANGKCSCIENKNFGDVLILLETSSKSLRLALIQLTK